MFVFPAFNEGYTKRKRTYKSCRKCRARRIKCILTSQDFESTGCENCKKNNVVCDLILPKRKDSGKESQTTSTESCNPPIPHFVPSGTPQSLSSVQNQSLLLANDSFNKRESHLSGTGERPARDSHSTSNAPIHYSPQVSTLPATQNLVPNTNIPLNNPAHSTSVSGSGTGPSPTIPGTNFTPVPVVADPARSTIPHQPYGLYYIPPYQSSAHSQPIGAVYHGNSSTSPLTPKYDVFNNGYLLPSPGALLSVPARNVSLSHREPGTTAPPSQPNHGASRLYNSPLGLNYQSEASNTVSSIPTSEPPPHVEDVHTESLNQQTPPAITAAYLHKKYRFVLNTSSQGLKYIPVEGEAGEHIDTIKVDEKLPSLRRVETFKYLESINAFSLRDDEFPINHDQEQQLFLIFFERINCVFTIVFEEQFWRTYNQGRCSSIVQYAMVLAVLRDAVAEPILILILGHENLLKKVENVAYKLDLKIRQLLMVMSELGDTDRLTRMVVLILLSISFQPDGMGNEQSSQDLFSAIGMSQTLLIHMESTHTRMIEDGKKELLDYLRKVWYTLYMFDRFNGVVCLKAFMIKDDDCNLQEPDDPIIKQLLPVFKRLHDVVFMLFKPQRIMESISKIYQHQRTTEEELQSLYSIEISNLEFVQAQIHIFKVYVCSIILMAIEKFELTKNKEEYKFSKQYLLIMSGVLSLLNQVAMFSDYLVPIPVLPSTTSLFLMVLLKYKIKVVYLTKMDLMKSRNDIDEAMLLQIQSLLESFYTSVDKHFGKWHFVAENLESARKICKTINTLDDKELQKTNTTQNDKAKIHLIITNDDTTIMPVATIASSDLFNVVSAELKQLLGKSDDEFKAKARNPIALHTPDVNMKKRRLTDNYNVIEEPDIDNFLLSQKDEAFATNVFSEFMTEDPTFREFFINMDKQENL